MTIKEPENNRDHVKMGKIKPGRDKRDKPTAHLPRMGNQLRTSLQHSSSVVHRGARVWSEPRFTLSHLRIQTAGEPLPLRGRAPLRSQRPWTWEAAHPKRLVKAQPRRLCESGRDLLLGPRCWGETFRLTSGSTCSRHASHQSKRSGGNNVGGKRDRAPNPDYFSSAIESI